MTTVEIRDDALRVLDSALGEWARNARGLVAQASAATRAMVTRVEHEVRRRAARLAAAEAALATCPPAQRAACQRAVEAATGALERGRRAREHAAAAAHDIEVLARRLRATVDGSVPAAQADLERRRQSLSGYRSGSAGGASAPSTGGPPGSGGSSALAGHGMTDVSLGEVRFDDNPIIDGFHKGGTTETDYRWAVETWDTLVKPRVLRGATREEFAARDAAAGAPAFRRSTDVYDMFLGDDKLLFSRRPDGSLDVVNGRHRIEIARRLGLTHLAGRIL